jgi:small nuclear ribonucleoprotein (snRNP)-like protein
MAADGPAALPIPARVMQDVCRQSRVVCQVELCSGYVYEGTMDSIDEHLNIVLLDATCQGARANHLRQIRTHGVVAPKSHVGTVFLNGSQILCVVVEDAPAALQGGYRAAVKAVKKDLERKRMKNRRERQLRLAGKPGAATTAGADDAGRGAKKVPAVSPKQLRPLMAGRKANDRSAEPKRRR